MMNAKGNEYYLLYINIAIFAICYQLQKPIEPFLVETLTMGKASSSAQEYAKLQSFFSMMQMVGSLLAGYMLDQISPKVGFYVSLLAGILSYVLVINSHTMSMLYISKIPTLFQAGMYE